MSLQDQENQKRKPLNLGEEGWNESIEEDLKFQKLGMIVNHQNQKKIEGELVSVITKSEGAEERNYEGDSGDEISGETTSEVLSEYLVRKTTDSGETMAAALSSIHLRKICLSHEIEVCDREEKEERARTYWELGGVDLSTNKEPPLSEPPEPPDKGVAKTELHPNPDLRKVFLYCTVEIRGRVGEMKSKSGCRSVVAVKLEEDDRAKLTEGLVHDWEEQLLFLVKDGCDRSSLERKTRSDWAPKEVDSTSSLMGHVQIQKPPHVHQWELGGVKKYGWDPGGIQQGRKDMKMVQLCDVRNLTCTLGTKLTSGALFFIANTIANGKYDTSTNPSKTLIRTLEISMGGEAIVMAVLNIPIEEIIPSLEGMPDHDKGVGSQLWSHINSSVQIEYGNSKEAIDFLYEWLMKFVGDSTTRKNKLMESSEQNEKNNSGIAKIESHKLMVDHLIHMVESSRMARTETHHKQWDPGEPYSGSCIIGTYCLKLWDPSGRVLIVCFGIFTARESMNEETPLIPARV